MVFFCMPQTHPRILTISKHQLSLHEARSQRLVSSHFTPVFYHGKSPFYRCPLFLCPKLPFMLTNCNNFPQICRPTSNLAPTLLYRLILRRPGTFWLYHIQLLISQSLLLLAFYTIPLNSSRLYHLDLSHLWDALIFDWKVYFLEIYERVYQASERGLYQILRLLLLQTPI